MSFKAKHSSPVKVKGDVFSINSSNYLITANLVVVREIPKSFDGGLTTQMIGKPDYQKIREQHEEFVNVMRRLGLKVIRLPAYEEHPDIHFPRDTIASYKGALMSLNPGAASRKAEVERNISDLEKVGIHVKRIEYPEGAFIEGGDVLSFDGEGLVVIGISGNSNDIRTNEAGAKAFAEALKTIDHDVTIVAVRHTGVLHLETGFTRLTKDLALKDPKCSIDWKNPYYPLGDGKRVKLPPWQIIELPEAEGYGAHVLPINGAVIIAKGYPTVKGLAEKYYNLVIEVDMSESHKMDGSLRCWTILHNENTETHRSEAKPL